MSTLVPETPIVLVADSEERVLQQVSTTLEKAGFKVLTARGRSAALEFCQDKKGPVQVAIIDSVMGSNDPALVREIFECYPHIRVLFTGSHDEPAAIQQAVLEGHSCGYLKKPFRRSRLLGSVLQAMDARLTQTAYPAFIGAHSPALTIRTPQLSRTLLTGEDSATAQTTAVEPGTAATSPKSWRIALSNASMSAVVNLPMVPMRKHGSAVSLPG